MGHLAPIAGTIAGASGWSDKRGMALAFLVVVLAQAWLRLGGRVADYLHPARSLALALATTVVLVGLSILAIRDNWPFGAWAMASVVFPAVAAIRAAADMRLRRRLSLTQNQSFSNRPTVERRSIAPVEAFPSPPLFIEETTLTSLAPVFRPPMPHPVRTVAGVFALMLTVPRAGAVRTLFLWVFAERPSDRLLSAARDVGPVYLLRGGGFLADRSLAVLLGDVDEHIEETEQEVLARLGSFERVRTRMSFASHSMLCTDRVWTFALNQLIHRTTCVVMDLRRYEVGRTGCEYEVGVLIDRVPLGKVAFVVESTANRHDVRALIERCWAQMATDSPNRQSEHTVRLVIAEHIDDDVSDNETPAYLPADREHVGFKRLLVDLAATGAAEFAR